MKLLVDDLRSFVDPTDTVVARSSAAANMWLDKNQGCVIDELWLDYDLGGFDTGMEVVKWLALQFTGEVKKVIVHSTHPHADRMVAGLEAVGIPVERLKLGFMAERDVFIWIPPDHEDFDGGV